MVGGGVVDVVTLDQAHWNHPPHKEEAGSPNVIGGVALAAAIEVLDRVGMETIASHERSLMEYAYRKLRSISGLTLYGPTDRLENKVGTIVFNFDHLHHSLVAAILSTEGAIGVRDGCFCAHPYVKELLQVPPDEDQAIAAEIFSGDRSRLPGMVRASLGCYSNHEDIDGLAEMLTRISRGEIKGKYHQEKATGAFHAEGFRPDFARYFRHFSSPIVRRIPSEAS
jgi:selenocysteine lyase/cysteine desulfurase